MSHWRGQSSIYIWHYFLWTLTPLVMELIFWADLEYVGHVYCSGLLVGLCNFPYVNSLDICELRPWAPLMSSPWHVRAESASSPYWLLVVRLSHTHLIRHNRVASRLLEPYPVWAETANSLCWLLVVRLARIYLVGPNRATSRRLGPYLIFRLMAIST